MRDVFEILGTAIAWILKIILTIVLIAFASTDV